MDRKTYQFTELKLDTQGEGTFEAVFATLDAIDHDGDTYDPGAIGNQDVVISQWNHGSWGGGASALPVGVGKIFERENKAIVSGEFDMGSVDGKAHHHSLKYLKEKGRNVEWSFALPDMDWRMEERDGQMIRVITRVEIPEVSPVLLGSGVDTELLSIKGREGNDVAEKPKADASTQFVTQVDEAVVAVESIIGRAKEIRNLREEKGKDDPMSKRNVRRLRDLKEAMADAITEVDNLINDPNDEFNALAASFTEGNNAD